MNAKMRQRIQAHLDEINAELDAPVEVARNGDGDSIKDMRAVYEKFGNKGVECYVNGHTWMEAGYFDFDCSVGCYRITAKYADKFDPDCMDFETWARAVIGRGMIVKVEWRDRCVDYGKEISNTGIIPALPSSFEHLCRFSAERFSNDTWTAITKAQYAEETAPKLYRQSEVDKLVSDAVLEFADKIGEVMEEATK